MFTGKVVATNKDIINNQIVVEVAVLKDGKEIERRKFGFPYETTEKELRSELDKFIKLYNDEYKQSLVQKEIDKKDKNADKVINSVKNLKI